MTGELWSYEGGNKNQNYFDEWAEKDGTRNQKTPHTFVYFQCINPHGLLPTPQSSSTCSCLPNDPAAITVHGMNLWSAHSPCVAHLLSFAMTFDPGRTFRLFMYRINQFGNFLNKCCTHSLSCLVSELGRSFSCEFSISIHIFHIFYWKFILKHHHALIPL